MQLSQIKEKILSQYESEGDEIINSMLNIRTRVQKKIDRQKYFETLEQIQKKK